jgi:hypothetical protein
MALVHLFGSLSVYDRADNDDNYWRQPVIIIIINNNAIETTRK